VLASAGETLAGVEGDFDLILTQYVLEHVADIDRTLAALHARLRPGGHVVHVLNSAVDRAGWYVTYRLEHSLLARLRASLATRGWRATARNPLEFTPPHEPRFGDYGREVGQYRLEAWALRVLRAGFEIVDHFQTRDVNWVLVTRPLAADGARA
jgi:SAM-dependent methyltransferase